MPQGHTRRSPASAKVAISLPAALLERLEELRDRTGESRSAVVRRALEVLLHRLDHYDAVHEYVESYRLHPETDDDLELGRPTVEEFGADEWNTDAGNSDEAG